MGIARQALLWASRQEWLGEQFRRRSFARRATSRFLPGEHVDAALHAARRLQQNGITALLSLLGEHVTTPSAAWEVTREYLDLLERAEHIGLPTQVSLKPTQLGLDLSGELCLEQFSTLLERMTSTSGFVWIDMESSAYVDRTLALFEKARERFTNIGVCVQAYLNRTAEDVERLIAQGAPIRLVKGAYNEPASVAMRRKRDVDVSFLQLAKRVLEAAAEGRGGLPVFGTHDVRLLDRAFEHASSRGVPRDAFEIQMLYGIAREHQRRLAVEGFQMRALISYGTAWFPWYMRRLAERPANVWFVVRSLFRR